MALNNVRLTYDEEAVRECNWKVHLADLRAELAGIPKWAPPSAASITAPTFVAPIALAIAPRQPFVGPRSISTDPRAPPSSLRIASENSNPKLIKPITSGDCRRILFEARKRRMSNCEEYRNKERLGKSKTYPLVLE